MSSDGDRSERAGDYVLGLMDAAERERAERDLAHDPAFREAVMRLAERYRAEAREPKSSDAVWREVEARLAEMPQMRAAVKALAKPRPAPVRRPSPASAAMPSVGGWRGALLAVCLVAACGIGFAAAKLLEVTPGATAFAVLEAADGTPEALVEAFDDDTLRVVPLRRTEVPDGKVLQVWTLVDVANAPLSLGTLGHSHEKRLETYMARPKEGQVFELTLETAPLAIVPNGPVLAKGAARLPAEK